MTELEQAILDFEGRGWRSAGVKEDAIRVEFGLGAVAYYQQLNGLLDREDALAYAPVLVNRLRRSRERVPRR